MNTRLILIAFISFAVLPCSCSAPQKETIAPEVDVTLEGPAWRCLSIGGVAITDERPPTLEFAAENRVSGFAGVNRYFGTFLRSGRTLAITSVGSTKMASTPERMDKETAFLQALSQVNSCSGTEHTLLLKSGNKVLLDFSR